LSTPALKKVRIVRGVVKTERGTLNPGDEVVMLADEAAPLIANGVAEEVERKVVIELDIGATA
jgi:hypothetical protein